MILACDLGTGGNKASLYDVDGNCLESSFVSYETIYPGPGMHEQRPSDWWNSVVQSTRSLMSGNIFSPADIEVIALSGHSLGVVPVDSKGNLLRESTPIWSDSRATSEARQFFERVEECQWYMRTGNGFPPPLYSIFKLMWYARNEGDLVAQTYRFLGTKDYINYLMTGRMVTDHSYASGSGVYDLERWDYNADFVAAGGIPVEKLPEIVPSTEVIGELLKDAAREMGLRPGIPVVCGGVDNSCMALGARNTQEGSVYTSLGSSSWIAVSSVKPVLDYVSRPYVFAHVVPKLYTSAVSIFSGGSSFRWVRDVICGDLVKEAARTGESVYEMMTAEATTSPPGARKLLFNPSLAGGTSVDPSPRIRGAFAGLDLLHTRADLIRASMEGIALNLGAVLGILREHVAIHDEMIVVGGGSDSTLWRQILADVFQMRVCKTNIGQEAGSLGAAALAAVGIGLWPGFEKVNAIHEIQDVRNPDSARTRTYEALMPVFKTLRQHQSDLGEQLHRMHLKPEMTGTQGRQ